MTVAERALVALGRGTFLSLWSYPNITRDEARLPNGKVIVKEVVDLLIVFEDHVVVFSDKDCAFPSTGNLDIDWPRWYRRAIAKSVAQVHGAERWIRQNPTRLFLDNRCEIPFPIPLPAPERMKVHRVVVAHGASEACRRTLGGNGTLMLW